jgi:hypothetical protein
MTVTSIYTIRILFTVHECVSPIVFRRTCSWPKYGGSAITLLCCNPLLMMTCSWHKYRGSAITLHMHIYNIPKNRFLGSWQKYRGSAVTLQMHIYKIPKNRFLTKVPRLCCNPLLMMSSRWVTIINPKLHPLIIWISHWGSQRASSIPVRFLFCQFWINYFALSKWRSA